MRKKAYQWVKTGLVIFCGVLLILGSGGGNGGNGGNVGTSPAPAPQVTPSLPTVATGVVGSTGGTVSYAATSLYVGNSISIPAGALGANTTITLTVSQVSQGIHANQVGVAFAITPHGTTFNTPVTVTLTFNPAALPAGTLSSQVKLIKQTVAGIQSTASNIIVDLINGTISGTFTSLSNFAVIVLPNNAPVANAGINQNVASGSTVHVKGVLAADITAPVITSPADVYAEATGLQSTVVVGMATAIDAVDVAPVISSNAPAIFPIGTTIVVWTATDIYGNVSTATQNIVVSDTAAPVITSPADVYAEATGLQSTVVVGMATAIDAVDVAPAISSNAPAIFPIGTTIVVWTATDIYGNVSTATQNIVVSDTIAPVVIPPVDYYVEAAGLLSTLAINSATASDAVDLYAQISSNQPAQFPLGITVVTWSGKDFSGNIGTANQRVIVSDTTAPNISAPANIRVAATSLQTVPSLVSATAIDIVDANPTITNNAPATFSIGITTIIWTATDFYGNASTATSTIDVYLVLARSTIDSILPRNSNKGELVIFSASVIAGVLPISGYQWAMEEMINGIATGNIIAELGDDPMYMTETDLPVGTWRIHFSVWDTYGAVSEATPVDITIFDGNALPDLSIISRDISITDNYGAVANNSQIGDLLHLKSIVKNIGYRDSYAAVITLFDEYGTPLVQHNINGLAVDGQADLNMPWVVGQDMYGNAIANFDNNYHILRIQIDHTGAEFSTQNNQASPLLIVGAPPSINGMFGIQLQARASGCVGGTGSLQGKGKYNWGSFIPVMGATVNVSFFNPYTNISFGDYNTHSIGNPMDQRFNGSFGISMQMPSVVGSYQARVTMFDNNLIGSVEIPVTVHSCPGGHVFGGGSSGGTFTPFTDLAIANSDVRIAGNGVHFVNGKAHLLTNSNVDLYATVRNIGTVDIAASFNVDFYAGDPYAGGLLLGTSTVAGGLLAGSSALVSTQMWNPTLAGAYTIHVIVDHPSVVIESNEYNNIGKLNVKVHNPLPDLRPYYFTARGEQISGIRFSSLQVKQGDVINIITDIFNIGTADAPANTYQIGYDLYANNGSTFVAHIGKRMVNVMLPFGTNVAASINWDTAIIQPGWYTVRATADVDHQLLEDNEGNNITDKRIQIYPAGAYLVPIGINYSNDYPLVGTPITVTGRVRNDGSLVAPSTPVDFYTSDPNIGGVGFAKGMSGQVASFGGLATSNAVTWNAPAIAGYYKICITVTARTYCRSIKVVAKAKPNLEILSTNITPTPRPALVNNPVDIYATISNVSGINVLQPFVVRFFIDGALGNGLQKIGNDISVPMLGAGTSVTVSATTQFTAIDPYYAILLKVIPNAVDGDVFMGNNAATTSLAVQGATFPPVITVPSNNITISTASPNGVLVSDIRIQDLMNVVTAVDQRGVAVMVANNAPVSFVNGTTIPLTFTATSGGLTAQAVVNVTIIHAASSTESALEMGGLHSHLLDENGGVWAWGDDRFGQAGDGLDSTGSKNRPVRIMAGGSGVIDQSSGYSQTLVVKSDGSLWGWGHNASGQVGNGTVINTHNPVMIAPSGSNFTRVFTGARHSLALKRDGSLWAWGSNVDGQLGDGSNVNRLSPVQILPANSGILQVDAGRTFTVLLKLDGSVWTWGSDLFGELGNGAGGASSTPVQIIAPNSGIVQINAATNYVIAVKSDGTMLAWGANDTGQLGDGTNINRRSPISVSILGQRVREVAIGGWGGTAGSPVGAGLASNFSMALTSSGTVFAWGSNMLGQLGDGSITGRNAPQQVNFPDSAPFSAIYAGAAHAMAVQADCSVWAWGYDAYGQLGDGSFTDKLLPVKMPYSLCLAAKTPYISITTAEDTAVTTVNVLNSYLTANGQAVSLSSVDTNSLQGGSLANNNNGTFTYMPSANYFGSDSFAYQLVDAYGSLATAEVLINVTPVNDLPYFSAPVNHQYNSLSRYSLILKGNQAVSFSSTAIDVDGDPLAFDIYNQAISGNAVIDAYGAVVYAPSLNFTGVDHFVLRVSDPYGWDLLNIDVIQPQISVSMNLPAVAPSSSITIQAQLTGAGARLANEWVQFTIPQTPYANSASFTGGVITLDGYTNANGLISVTITDAYAETVNVTVTAPNLSLTQTVSPVFGITSIAPDVVNGWGYNISVANGNCNSVWDIYGSPYLVLTPVVITSGCRLQIDANTIIKFATSASISTQNGGTLDIYGQLGAEVILTSINDDAYGGVFPGSTGTPKAGDWGNGWARATGIDYTTGSLGSMNHTQMRYGGSLSLAASPQINYLTMRDSSGGISISAGAPTISNLTMMNVPTHAINVTGGTPVINQGSITVLPIATSSYYKAITVSGATTVLTMSNMLIRGGWYNLSMSGGASGTFTGNTFDGALGEALILDGTTSVTMDASNLIQNAAAAYILNNAVGSLGTTLTPSISWNSMADPYSVHLGGTFTAANTVLGPDPLNTGNSVWFVDGFSVGNGARVQIDPYTVFKLQGGISVSWGGILDVYGQLGAEVIFTSLNDDSVGVTLPGSSGSPTAWDWGRVDYAAGSQGSMSNVEDRYGGWISISSSPHPIQRFHVIYLCLRRWTAFNLGRSG